MFGSRRRRAAANPPLDKTTANPAATTAATSAFLKDRSSNVSLSSAAAAAALKARPMSPTSVADVQTKRTMRRSGSTSSMGSSVNGSQRSGTPQLERRLSSGSMTERTFRDPSPGRPVRSAPDAPPVPAIPQNLQSAAHRRANSLEAPPVRISSPASRTTGGRGVSMDPEGAKRAGQRSSLSSVQELANADWSRGSVNFSYPTNSELYRTTSQRRLTSPSPSRQNPPQITTANNQSLIYDPNTRSFLPAVEVHAIQQRLYDAANQPVKKKKRVAPGIAAGSHLADGTASGRPKGTAVNEILEARARQLSQPPVKEPEIHTEQEPTPSFENVPELAAEPTTTPTQIEPQLPKKKKKRPVAYDSESDQGSYMPNSSDNDSDAIIQAPRKNQQLGKKPSIVREDREREEEEAQAPIREKPSSLAWDPSRGDLHSAPSPPLPRSKAGRAHGKGVMAVAPLVSPEVQELVNEPEPVKEPEQAVQLAETVEESNEPPLQTNGSVRGNRVSSLSPGRNAHFAPSPDNLMVKHQPPPRSISPRKSALKQPNSRNSSPIATHGSETSNSPGAGEDQPLPRKKSVRVSFDETNVIVGEAAPLALSDPTGPQSPQLGKRPWYSIGRGKKKDMGFMSTDDDEEDKVMKPRPALPFFGSVRERKNRDVEERALVKPAEPVEAKPAARSLLSKAQTENANETLLGQSNDHVVGAILAQDSMTKNAANISKSREPLPPQVTSVEGSGYSSGSDSGASSGTPATVVTEPEEADAVEPEFTKPTLEPDAILTTQDSNPIEDENSDNTPTPTREADFGAIPEISISRPTPNPEDIPKREGWPAVPGSWEGFASEAAHVSFREPVAAHSSPKNETEHIFATPVIMEETESEADVFSDAVEELTDSEEEGFQSLNAVVESPITSTASAIPNPPDSPTSKLAKEKAISDGQGWEKAQEYWTGLSTDMKQQLELDAMRDAQEGSDTEVEAKPKPKPKQKKNPIRQAPPQQIVSTERTYMIQPGSKAGPGSPTPMRTSMRAPAPVALIGDPPMRKTMRNTGQEPRGSLQKKNRPVSLPVEPRATPVATHARNFSSSTGRPQTVTSIPQALPPGPSLRRKNSGDSESSFKRSRPERRMIGTMRGNSGPIQQQEPSSSRFSIRSLSPTTSITRRPFSSQSAQLSDPSHMRMSMRGSVGPTPTMRGPPKRQKSSSSMKIPGFGRSSKQAKPANPSRSFGSRFADSSDEEDERPAFRSRFIDSSDDEEDEPVRVSSNLGLTMRSQPAAPPVRSSGVRGIPRQSGVEDGDSSSLPDSDDENPTSPTFASKLSKKRQPNGGQLPNGATQNPNAATTSLRRSGSGRGTITTISAPTQARPPQKRRGSIMSILRRKKDDTSKVRKSDAESPARRDTPLERSKSDLQALRSPSNLKLQKRNPLSRENSILASPLEPLGSNEQQLQASGVEADERFEANENPGLGSRRATSDEPFNSLATANGTTGVNGVAFGEAKKKKKFASLRRMLRLHD